MELKMFKEPVREGGRLKMEMGEYVFAYGLEGLKIWIEKALKPDNKRLFYEGLDSNYGNELYSFVGRPLTDDVAMAVFDNVQSCLCANPYIQSVSLIGYEIKGDRLSMVLNVATVYGNTESKVEI